MKLNKRILPIRLRYFIYGITFSLLVMSFLTGIGCTSNYARTNPNTNKAINYGEASALPQGTASNAVTADISTAAIKVMPAVVGITTSQVNRDRNAQTSRVQGVGSGVIVDPNGFILTNNHVAGVNAQNITVYLYDGREVKGRTVWADPVLDLAVVKINADKLSYAPIGNSQGLRIGQTAVAIGNPLGLSFQRTVTAGIVSAVNRTIEVDRGAFMEGLIQTDASINPGNSGGPLINVNGEIIGINTVKVITAEGMGFAVPINVAKPVLQKISSTGSFTTPTLGVQGLDKELSGIYNFVVDKGVYVFECKEGGCAHKSGVKTGDVILSIDGKEVNTACQMKEALYSAGAGNTVKIKVKDKSGKIKDIQVKLDAINE